MCKEEMKDLIRDLGIEMVSKTMVREDCEVKVVEKSSFKNLERKVYF